MTAENTKLSGVNPKLAAKGLIKRATSPVLTSDKEEKRMILPTTLNFTVRRDKLRIYTLQNPLGYLESLSLLEATRKVL